MKEKKDFVDPTTHTISSKGRAIVFVKGEITHKSAIDNHIAQSNGEETKKNHPSRTFQLWWLESGGKEEQQRARRGAWAMKKKLQCGWGGTTRKGMQISEALRKIATIPQATKEEEGIFFSLNVP